MFIYKLHFIRMLIILTVLIIQKRFFNNWDLITRNMNANSGKDRKNKFCLHNSPNKMVNIELSFLLRIGFHAKIINSKKCFAWINTKNKKQTGFWSLAKRFISIIYVYNQPRLHTIYISRSNKRKWIHIKKKKQESNDILQKLWPTQNT